MTDTDDPRIELRDARSGKPTGTIPLSVLTSMGVTIPETGAYWFSAELCDAIRRHPEWTEGP